MRRKLRDIIWLIQSKFHRNVMVCYGTSLTEGSGWVDLLRKELPKWHIVNLAKGGMNSNWGVDNIKLVKRFKPKVILMEWAINDSYEKCPYYKPTNKQSSLANIVTMLNAFKDSKIFMLGMNPPFNKFLFSRNPYTDRIFYWWFSNRHREIAKRNNISYIDITSEWNKLTEFEFLYYCPDGLHPNINASKDITVPTIIAFLRKMNYIITSQ